MASTGKTTEPSPESLWQLCLASFRAAVLVRGVQPQATHRQARSRPCGQGGTRRAPPTRRKASELRGLCKVRRARPRLPSWRWRCIVHTPSA